MNNIIKLFKKIDQFIFLKLDLFKNDSNFKKFNDLKSNFNEDQQKMLSQILVFGIIFIPFIIAGFLSYGNYKIKKNIEIKTQILEQISQLNSNHETLNTTSSQYVSSSAYATREDLDNKLRNIFSAKGLDQSKISITDFNQISSRSTSSKIEATIHFENFGTQDFSIFLSTIVDAEKFKVQKVSLLKNKTNNLLQGDLTLVHIGRNSQM
jgi:hypothetical protein